MSLITSQTDSELPHVTNDMAVATDQRFFALIPCAGTGSRAGGSMPKQYQALAGKPMLYHSVAAFSACAFITQTLLVLSPEDEQFRPDLLDGLRFHAHYCGGASRQASVKNGLETLIGMGAGACDWVLVHDAARPGLTPELIGQLINALTPEDCGAILALPVADTLKQADDSGNHIAATRSRDGMWAAQTPQLFPIGALLKALIEAEQQGLPVTDEASAMEAIGGHPRLVRGHLCNLKVTYPEDFALVAQLISSRS